MKLQIKSNGHDFDTEIEVFDFVLKGGADGLTDGLTVDDLVVLYFSLTDSLFGDSDARELRKRIESGGWKMGGEWKHQGPDSLVFESDVTRTDYTLIRHDKDNVVVDLGHLPQDEKRSLSDTIDRLFKISGEDDDDTYYQLINGDHSASWESDTDGISGFDIVTLPKVPDGTITVWHGQAVWHGEGEDFKFNIKEGELVVYGKIRLN